MGEASFFSTWYSYAAVLFSGFIANGYVEQALGVYFSCLGIDPFQEEARRNLSIGKTIILASRDMGEVENLCDRIAILSGGKIAFIGTVEQLGETIGKHYNVTIQTENGTEKYESENIGNSLLSLLMQYKEKGETITDIRIDRGSLEQHFIKIAKGE